MWEKLKLCWNIIKTTGAWYVTILNGESNYTLYTNYKSIKEGSVYNREQTIRHLIISSAILRTLSEFPELKPGTPEFNDQLTKILTQE